MLPETAHLETFNGGESVGASIQGVGTCKVCIRLIIRDLF